MPLYHERLWPSAWMFLSTALVIPASFLVLLPINPFAGIITAAVLYAGIVTLLLVSAPKIEVTRGELIAGRARLPLSFAGEPLVFDGEEARQERGPVLDARAWLVIRGWIPAVVKIPVTDPADPAPYWLVSSRRPHDMATAVLEARTAVL